MVNVSMLGATVNGPNGSKLQLFGYEGHNKPNHNLSVMKGRGEWIVYELDDNGKRMGCAFRISTEVLEKWNV